MQNIEAPQINSERLNGEKIIVRDLIAEEIPELLAFDHKAYFVENTDTPLDHRPPEWTSQEMEEAFARADIIRGLFNSEGALIGYYEFETRPSDLYLNIVVDRNYRDKGLGSYFMQMADYEARIRRISKCALTVDQFNSRGINLYFKSGYQVVGYHKDHFGPNVHRLLMEKDLSAEQRKLSDETILVSCFDDDKLGIANSGYVGVELKRDPSGNPKENSIVFRKKIS